LCCIPVISARGELQQAVLHELASSALEILQQEQEQADTLPPLPPLPAPFLGSSRHSSGRGGYSLGAGTNEPTENRLS